MSFDLDALSAFPELFPYSDDSPSFLFVLHLPFFFPLRSFYVPPFSLLAHPASGPVFFIQVFFLPVWFS